MLAAMQRMETRPLSGALGAEIFGVDLAAPLVGATVAALRVSSHLLIRRDGELVQYVPFHRRAWHAGVSSWQGRERCNDYSIGIELEGADDTPYESGQYAMLARVIATLCRAIPALTAERVVGHSDVAPGRKTDPGPAFDWDRVIRETRRLVK